jgi:hypothetical protein
VEGRSRQRWLEVVRAVVDGSSDHRREDVYAETPDRAVLLLMVSVGASIGEMAVTGDAVRAYLNAEALDRNLVVISSKYMVDIPKVGVLNKGLYGTLKGALGWEKWIEGKVCGDMEFVKCDLSRSIYTKEVNGQMVRMFRHSDDFRISSKGSDELTSVSEMLSGMVRMSPWVECKRFLGLTFEYLQQSEKFSDGGNMVVVRGSDKIDELVQEYGYLKAIYNMKGKMRVVPLPLSFIKKDEELEGEYGVALDASGKKIYLGLVGKIGYIATSLRWDVRFGYLVLSRRLASPREWEMFLAVWVMEYLGGTRDMPLILGGKGVDMKCFSDASFGILEERRSVKAHLLRTGEKSGAVFVSSGAIKNAVTSIWEAEVNAASDAVDTILYAGNVGRELRYPVGEIGKVMVDNESAIAWLGGAHVSTTTKHVETRLFRMKHLVQDRLVDVEYVRSEENVSDVLTKSLPAKKFRELVRDLMGHEMVRGMEVRGVEY